MGKGWLKKHPLQISADGRSVLGHSNEPSKLTENLLCKLSSVCVYGAVALFIIIISVQTHLQTREPPVPIMFAAVCASVKVFVPPQTKSEFSGAVFVSSPPRPRHDILSARPLIIILLFRYRVVCITARVDGVRRGGQTVIPFYVPGVSLIRR